MLYAVHALEPPPSIILCTICCVHSALVRDKRRHNGEKYTRDGHSPTDGRPTGPTDERPAVRCVNGRATFSRNFEVLSIARRRQSDRGRKRFASCLCPKTPRIKGVADSRHFNQSIQRKGTESSYSTTRWIFVKRHRQSYQNEAQDDGADAGYAGHAGALGMLFRKSL